MNRNRRIFWKSQRKSYNHIIISSHTFCITYFNGKIRKKFDRIFKCSYVYEYMMNWLWVDDGLQRYTKIRIEIKRSPKSKSGWWMPFKNKCWWFVNVWCLHNRFSISIFNWLIFSLYHRFYIDYLSSCVPFLFLLMLMVCRRRLG